MVKLQPLTLLFFYLQFDAFKICRAQIIKKQDCHFSGIKLLRLIAYLFILAWWQVKLSIIVQYKKVICLWIPALQTNKIYLTYAKINKFFYFKLKYNYYAWREKVCWELFLKTRKILLEHFLYSKNLNVS